MRLECPFFYDNVQYCLLPPVANEEMHTLEGGTDPRPLQVGGTNNCDKNLRMCTLSWRGF